jgi:hypothetical protein
VAAGRAGTVAEAGGARCETLGFFDFVTDLCSKLGGNPLGGPWGSGFGLEFALENARRVQEIIAATTHIGMIRDRATEICIGLQDLELPAFVTLSIIDEAVHENSIRMWAKWELITAVKHFVPTSKE